MANTNIYVHDSYPMSENIKMNIGQQINIGHILKETNTQVTPENIKGLYNEMQQKYNVNIDLNRMKEMDPDISKYVGEHFWELI